MPPPVQECTGNKGFAQSAYHTLNLSQRAALVVAALMPPMSGAAVALRKRSGPASLDYLVGEQLHRIGHIKTERVGGLNVDHELVLGRQLHRKISGICSTENAINDTAN